MTAASLSPIPYTLSPVVLLVRPQLGENIGAAARAMSNFGLTELRLAAPREAWPNPKALKMAPNAEPILQAAQCFPDFTSAMADIQHAYAATARPRDMHKRVLTPEAAARQMSEIRYQMSKETSLTFDIRHLTSATPRVALVFGPERTGLENEEITLCDTIVTIPTAENSSLNLAQSVVVLGYEWWKASAECRVLSTEGKDTLNSALSTQHSPAPKEDWLGLFDQLEGYLDAADYFRTPDKKPLMWQNLKTMLLRGEWNAQEVRTFRGMLRGMWEQRRHS